MGGRAAVIVPDGVLFGASKAHKQAREMLINECELQGVISMPSGVFKPYAGVSTAVLIFVKGGRTENVWFYDMNADGFSLDDKRDRIDKNDIPEIMKRWKVRNHSDQSNRKAKFFLVPVVEIKENGYDLSINRYKEIDYEQIEYLSPEAIINGNGSGEGLKDLLTKRLDLLNEMENLLK